MWMTSVCWLTRENKCGSRKRTTHSTTMGAVYEIKDISTKLNRNKQKYINIYERYLYECHYFIKDQLWNCLVHFSFLVDVPWSISARFPAQTKEGRISSTDTLFWMIRETRQLKTSQYIQSTCVYNIRANVLSFQVTLLCTCLIVS